ncbi:MAG: hypothetical protein LBV30_05055 [Propionibacteriaceae bacterium]|jgi:hypothetical protein|nr:hypothetical protein [Propionibacteriaceae bacterium]
MIDAPIWTHLHEHSETRSERHHGDQDIPVAWAIEAWQDPLAALLDPDPKSKTSQSIRLIGWSESAGHLITIIAVRFNGDLYAASAWKSNQRDGHIYQQED